jgi:hypothetical protein
MVKNIRGLLWTMISITFALMTRVRSRILYWEGNRKIDIVTALGEQLRKELPYVYIGNTESRRTVYNTLRSCLAGDPGDSKFLELSCDNDATIGALLHKGTAFEVSVIVKKGEGDRVYLEQVEGLFGKSAFQRVTTTSRRN